MTAVHPGWCFKCGAEIRAAVSEPREHGVWEMPSGAVHFTGGGNFGSTRYDTLMDGVEVEILVCDECLKAHRRLVRHVRMGSNLPVVLEIRYGDELLDKEREAKP